MAHVIGENIDESPEWEGISEEDNLTIPEFGIEPEGGKTQEEIDAEAAAAAAASSSKTQEEIDAEAAAAAGKTPEEIAAAAAAAKGDKTPEQIAAAEKLAEKERIRKELLAEMGVESVDEIKKLKEPTVAETEEEKVKRLEKQEASFHQYAVQHDMMSLAEINSYKQLSAIPEHDLVYNDFASEYKEANKDRKDDGKDDPVTDEEVAEAFETAYGTKSDNAVLKKAGERAIAARAKEILADSKQKYDSAKEYFDGLMDRKAKIPEFKTFIQSTLTAAIPPKYEFKVDGRDFSVVLDGKDFAEIENKFKDDEIFAKFYDTNDRQGLQESIKDEAERQIAKKYIQKVAEIANRTGYDAGVKARPVGAKVPFEGSGTSRTAAPSSKLTDEEKRNIREGIGQY